MKKKKLHCIILVALIGILMMSCSESDDEIKMDCEIDPYPCEFALQLLALNDTCFELPPTPVLGWLFESAEYLYSGALINQSNSDEFIFSLNAIDDSTITDNYIVDICTNEKFKFGSIPGGVVNGTFSWGGNDWMVYLGPDIQLHKVKSDGSMFTQITFGSEPFEYITWIDEQTILSNTVFPDLSPPNRSVLVNIETHEIVDTLDQAYPHPAFYNGKVASDVGFLGEKEIGYLELDNMEFIPLLSLTPYSEYGDVRQIDWLDEDHIIWIDKKGLHIINIISEEETLLIEFCENTDIYLMSVFPEKDGRLFLSRRERWPLNEQLLLSKHRIIYYDTNTSEQWEINLAP